jgi:hypothetical protein
MTSVGRGPHVPRRRLLISIVLALPILIGGCARETAREPGAEIAERSAPPAAESPQDLAVEVRQLRADGPDIVVLQLSVTNLSSAPRVLANRFAAAQADRGTVADLSLVDRRAGTRYFVLRDRQRRPVCSRELSPLAPGERRTLWAKFPAPPAGARELDVIVPGAPPLRGIPLSAERARPAGN